VPELVGLNDAEQLAVVALTVVNVQGEPVKLPAAVPVFDNATVPAGVLAVPAAVTSFTNAVQLTDWATTTELGEHEMVVEVVLSETLTVLLEPLLVRWPMSLGL